MTWPDALPGSDDLIIRQVCSRDASDIFHVVDANRLYLQRWLPWVDRTTTVSDVASFVRSAQELAKQGDAVHYALLLGHHVFGVAGFARVDAATRIGTLGFWLAEDQQGKGLMTAACRELIREGCCRQGMAGVEMFCDHANLRSRAVAGRLGLEQSAIAPAAPAADLLHYSIPCGRIVRFEAERTNPSTA